MANQESDIEHLPDWLSEEIFADILKSEHESFDEIKKFKGRLAVRDGENYSTTLLRITVGYQLKDGSAHETSFIVKVAPSSDFMKDLVKEWQLFEKETYTYSVLIPAFEEMFKKTGKVLKFGPKLYKVDPAKTQGNSIVVLEDLKLRDFKNIKRQEGLDLEHTQAILQKLAQFHSASAVYFEEHGPYPEMYQQVLPSKEDKFAEFREKQCSEFRECLDLYEASHLDEKIKTYRTNLPDEYQRKRDINPDVFQCLDHGDLWCNNFMFQYDSDGKLLESLFIDLQMGCYSSPNHDLYYLLLSSTKREIKIKLFDYLVGYYHQHLVDNLKLLNYPKPMPTLRGIHMELLRDCGWAFTTIINVLPLALLDPMEEANIDNVLSLEEKKDTLKKQMYRNKRFVDHMSIILPWMDNKGMLD